MSIPLAQSGSATFASDGAGGAVARVSLGPIVYGVRWLVKRMVTATTGSQTDTLRVYRNVEQNSQLLDSTYSAFQATSETNIDLQTNEKLLFVWRGEAASIGAIGTITLQGDVFDTRRGE